MSTQTAQQDVKKLVVKWPVEGEIIFTLNNKETGWEVVITVPMPDDKSRNEVFSVVEHVRNTFL